MKWSHLLNLFGQGRKEQRKIGFTS